MNTQQCLEILQLDCVSSVEDLADAYRKQSQNFQPDRFRGFPSLEEKAAKRSREIKLAYEHLLSYFDPVASKRLRTSEPNPKMSLSISTNAPQSDDHAAGSSINFCEVANDAGSPEPHRFENFQTYPAKTKMPVRRVVLLGFWCLIIGGVGGLIYLASNWEVTASKPMGATTEVIDNAVDALAIKPSNPPQDMDTGYRDPLIHQ